MIFSSFFKHASIGILVSDQNGTIILSNPWATELLKYENEELIGLNIDTILPQESYAKCLEYREKFYSSPQEKPIIGNIDLKVITKNGDLQDVEVYLFDYETEAGRQSISFLNQFSGKKETRTKLEKIAKELESRVEQRTRELSEALTELNFAHNILEKEVEQRKDAEMKILSSLEKERELNELKSRFVCMASHEFRTPLAGILTSASLLQKYHEAGNTSKVEKHVSTIKRSVKNLTTILNEFLSLDKLDQGIIEPHISTFSLAVLIQEIVEELIEYSDCEQKIIVRHQKTDIDLVQDHEMLRTILINLLSNAVKYSEKDTSIEIESRIIESKLHLRISDQGIGIPQSDQKHLFERFFRAKNVNTIQGTGLGLSIVRSYLELMGGGIIFSSKEDEGTTFNIHLPLERK